MKLFVRAFVIGSAIFALIGVGLAGISRAIWWWSKL